MARFGVLAASLFGQIGLVRAHATDTLVLGAADEALPFANMTFNPESGQLVDYPLLPGQIGFRVIPGGKCGFGGTAYYGWMPGDRSSKKFFLELMGGAVCFNKSSCSDNWLGAWMDIEKLLKMNYNFDTATWVALSGGMTVPVDNAALKGNAYFPIIKTQDGHPYKNAPGVYFPTCNADIMMGQHSLKYEDMDAYHHGALNLNVVLQAIKREYPELDEFLILGGSGGGVSSSIWMSKVAEMWPSTNVIALVDSGFHMFPGSNFFKFFYEHVEWSAGPHGDSKRIAMPTGQSPPPMNWQETTAIADQLKAHSNLKVAYIACDKDWIVDDNRERMDKASEFNGSSIQQMDEMWTFLKTLTGDCSLAGKAFSYIADCTAHHLSKQDMNAITIGQDINLKMFVDNFLKGTAPDTANADKAHFWYEQAVNGGLMTACPSTPSPPMPSPSPSPTPSGGGGTCSRSIKMPRKKAMEFDAKICD